MSCCDSLDAVGETGAEVPWLITQNQDNWIDVTLNNPVAEAGDPVVPVDLTGCTFESHIRKNALDVALVVAVTVVVVAAAAGQFRYGLTRAQASAIPCGERPSDSASRYKWDLFMTDSLNQRTRLFFGQVNIAAAATHGA